MTTIPGVPRNFTGRTQYVRYSDGSKSSVVITVQKMEDGSLSRIRPTPGIHHRVGRRWGALPYSCSAIRVERTAGEIRKAYNSTFYQQNICPSTNANYWTFALGLADLGSYAAVLDNMAARARVEATVALMTQSRDFDPESKKSQGVDFQLGESIAESAETARMIADRAIPLGKALLAAKRGDWSSVAKHLSHRRIAQVPKDVTSGWLEYQYGWKPLMADIHGAWTAMTEGFARNQQVISTRSRNTGVVTRKQSFSLTNNVNKVGEIAVDVVLRAEAGLSARVSDSRIAALSSMGLLNPVEVAWELVPFSFAIDWFIPVGSIISSYTAPAGLTFVDGYETRCVEASWTGELPAYWAASGAVLLGDYPQGLVSITAMRRTVMGSFPLPVWYSMSNPFKSNIRKANAVSLIVQQLVAGRHGVAK